MGENLPTMQKTQETQVQFLGQEEHLEEVFMTTHSRILDRKIPRTEEPSGLQSIALQRDTAEAPEHEHSVLEHVISLRNTFV